MRLHIRPSTVALGLSLGLTLALFAPVVAPSLAQAAPQDDSGGATDEELAAARTLFKDALKLEARKKWSEALVKLEKVRQVKMTPQVRYHLAYCHEHLGRWVEAVNGFELAEQEARRDKAPAVLENAPRRARKLRARLPHLRLTTDGPIHTSTILIDGKPFASALIDTEIPIDPGLHTIDVKRDGESIYSDEVELKEAQRKTLNLPIDDPKPKDIEPPTPGPKPLPDPKPGGGTEPGPKPMPGPTTPDEADQPSRVPAYILWGAGGAALIGGGVMWWQREVSLGKLGDTCDEGTFENCDPDSKADADAALGYDIGAKVAFGVGGAALIAGTVMFFAFAPNDDAAAEDEKTEDEGLTVVVAPFHAGLQLVGQF